MMKLGIVILLQILFITPYALADSGWYSYINGPVGTEQENLYISMMDEQVEIRLNPQNADVTATFTFTNFGSATEVGMYFPLAEGGGSDLAYSGDEEDHEEPLAPSEADRYGFLVTVDNQTVPSELVRRITYGEIYLDSEAAHFDNLDFARWSVPFEHNQTRQIVCSFAAPYETGKHGEGPDYFTYILYTGASWAGPIQEGRITVSRSLNSFNIPIVFATPEISLGWDWDNEKDLIFPKPNGTVTAIPPAEVTVLDDDEEITWEFSNYEPGEGASIEIFLGGDVEKFLPNIQKPVFEKIGFASYEGQPGVVLANGLNFRLAPEPSAGQVEEQPQLQKGTPLQILEARGEWWRVRTKEGNEGWIRWRYVDPESGEEHIYATIYWESTG
jgi:hypothetical protein